MFCMAFYPPEVVAKARELDLFSYLKTYEPQELVHVSGNVYCTRTHDSLRISNGKWCWFSRGIGGYSALDYLIKVNGYSFQDAMETITRQAAVQMPFFVQEPEREKPKQLLLPRASPTNDGVIAYLKSRGIDRELIDDCIRAGRIFESLPHHNAVFIGFDKKGRARFGCQRGIGDTRFMGDLNGSDKHYSFALPAASGQNRGVHLFESAIDLLSYATLCKLEGMDWRRQNLLSLAGIYQPRKKIEESKIPAALTRFLEEYPHIQAVVLHLDNDGPGRLAARAIMTVLPKDYTVLNRPPSRGKDVNDYLCLRLGLSIRGAKEPER